MRLLLVLSVEFSKMVTNGPQLVKPPMTVKHHQEASWPKAHANTLTAMGSTTPYGINDAAEPLKDEHRGPVVVQVVALGCLNAHGHEGLGFRFCTCQKSKRPSWLGKCFAHRNEDDTLNEVSSLTDSVCLVSLYMPYVAISIFQLET